MLQQQSTEIDNETYFRFLSNGLSQSTINSIALTFDATTNSSMFISNMMKNKTSSSIFDDSQSYASTSSSPPLNEPALFQQTIQCGQHESPSNLGYNCYFDAVSYDHRQNYSNYYY
jgi:hypothetical protein